MEQSGIGVNQPILRISGGGFFQFLQCTIHVAHAGQRIALKDMCRSTRGLSCEYFFGASAGIVELAGCEREVAGEQLNIGVVREQVGRANDLREGVAHITVFEVRLRQLLARLPELPIELQRPTVFENGLGVLTGCQIGVAARQRRLLVSRHVS